MSSLQSEPVLRIITPAEVSAVPNDAVEPLAREQANAILEDIRRDGLDGVLAHAVRLGDIPSLDTKWLYTRDECKEYYDALPEDQQALLIRTCDRIRTFAMAQRASISNMEINIPGGKAGHNVEPVSVAGCYAPGGRYPLPSSVLMTAVTARAAGVAQVWVASPRPVPVTLAAAYVSEADGIIAVGGAQAIGAFAYGTGHTPKCDVIVGPGNKWVTAAKSLVSGVCAIDMLAGPSEVLVIADQDADADTVAADLLAQAEHDVEARPILVSPALEFISKVNTCIQRRLSTLPTAATARQAVLKGFAVHAHDIQDCVRVSDLVAPEHLEVVCADYHQVGKMCSKYGALFLGHVSAEVLGDYGAGPNHVLPTGGTARYTGGLSVFTFLCVRTWMHLDTHEATQEQQQLIRDASALARLEGLEAHARAAECRITEP